MTTCVGVGGGAADTGGTILYDDFESYPLGDFPSQGWLIINSGWNLESQTVDDTGANPGAKSFKLEGAPNHAASIQRDYTLPDPGPTVIVVEATVKVTRQGPPIIGYRDFALWAGQYGSLAGSHCFASLDFVPMADGKEYLFFNNYQYQGPEVVLGRWYRLRVRLDLVHDMGTVWLDDALVFSGVPLDTNSSFHFAPAITLEGGNSAHTRSWIDDVRVSGEAGSFSSARADLDPSTVNVRNLGHPSTAYLNIAIAGAGRPWSPRLPLAPDAAKRRALWQVPSSPVRACRRTIRPERASD